MGSKVTRAPHLETPAGAKKGLGPYLTFELPQKFLNIYSLDSGCDLITSYNTTDINKDCQEVGEETRSPSS